MMSTESGKESTSDAKRSPDEMSDEELLDAVAGRVVRMRLGVPAVFFLESTKPLSFLGSQLLVFLQPFVQAFLTIRSYERFSQLMEDRQNVERLIRRVEELDEDLRAKEKRDRLEERKRRDEERARRGKKPRRWFWQR
jgi:hypothetical protein